MDIAEKIKALAGRVEKLRSNVLTEEACKNAFVMPFLSALNYDVFDPEIVVPEFVADVGVKKGEKVDYAIRIGGKIALLVECKGCGKDLSDVHMSQLYRYFSVTEARFAILTNGIDYWFYTDLDEANKMDQRPFFRFNVLDYRPDDIQELQKFAIEMFDVDNILSTANNLKYSSAIKAELMKEFDDPSEDFIRMLVVRVFDGRFTQRVRDEFSPLVSSAIRDAVRDMVNQRITTALDAGSTGRPLAVPAAVPETADVSGDRNSEIETTEEELEAFHIIRAIVRPEVKSDRVVMRDAKTYCAILIDNNNRRPLARLYFNGKSVKYVGLFDSERQEERCMISGLDDIYGFADRLKKAAAMYKQA
jgi:predicted type IV restriction endonuclease